MNLTLNTTAMTPRARIVTQVLSPVPFLFAATSCRESRSGRRQACANAGVHGRKSKSSTAVESELAVPQRILYRCDQHRVTANHFHLLDAPVRCDDYFHFHRSLHSIFFRKFGIRWCRMRNGFPSLRRLRPHRRNQQNGQEQHHQKDKYSLPFTRWVPLHRFASPGAASSASGSMHVKDVVPAVLDFLA